MLRQPKSSQTNRLATWTFVGSLLTCTLLGVATHGFSIVIPDLSKFLQGKVSEIANQPSPFIMMVPVILAVVALKTPTTLIGAVIQRKILGMHSQHALKDLLKEMTEDTHFFKFIVIVLVEELFARYLFLGLLPKIHFLQGTAAFYILAFTRNRMPAG